MIADGDFVAALASIQLKNEEGEEENHMYCDVWQFRDGLIAGLKAFVIKSDG
jgi:uncharacterized protein